jgi:hypothetical protein
LRRLGNSGKLEPVAFGTGGLAFGLERSVASTGGETSQIVTGETARFPDFPYSNGSWSIFQRFCNASGIEEQS